MLSYINGQFVQQQEAVIPVSDLGLQRGYGVFDFLRVKGNTPLFLDQHIDRLFRSLEKMRLVLPYSKDALKEIIALLIQQNQLAHSGIRITVTGGASPDGYTPVDPHIIIVQQAIPAPPDQMLVSSYRLVSYAYRRQLPEVKTTDYLMAIWLQPWIKEQGAQDVLYHWDGAITECPRSNFFIVSQDNVIVTADSGMLKGVTRANILQVAAKHFKVEERTVTLNDLHTAKEAFIASSTKRIIPVSSVDDILFESYTDASVAAKLFDELCLLENAVLTKV